MATGGDFSDVELEGSKDLPVQSNRDVAECSDYGDMNAGAIAAPFSEEGGDNEISLTGVVYKDKKRLNLDARGLKKLPPGLLNLRQLQILYLDFNLIHRLPEDFFIQLPSLQWFDISYNCLTELPHLGLENHKSLTGLVICHNQITSLPMEIGTIKGLMVFLCYGNPLEFPCDIPIVDSSRVLTYLCNQTSDLVIENPAGEEHEALARSLQLQDFVVTSPLPPIHRPPSRLAPLPPIAGSGDAGSRPRRCAREHETQEPSHPEEKGVDFGTWISRTRKLEDWFKRLKDGDEDLEDDSSFLAIPALKENPPYGVNEPLIAEIMQLLRDGVYAFPNLERLSPSVLPSASHSREELFKLRLRMMYKVEKSIRKQNIQKYVRRQVMPLALDPEMELKAAVCETMQLEESHLQLASIRYELENM